MLQCRARIAARDPGLSPLKFHVTKSSMAGKNRPNGLFFTAEMHPVSAMKGLRTRYRENRHFRLC